MRVSREQFRANRTRILDEAGKLFREHGFDGVTLADVMNAAGLTHGGFYGHFRSKDELIEAALAHRSEAQPARPRKQSAADYADAYLSRKHRDTKATSCPISCLGTEAARASDSVRHSMTALVREEIDRLAEVSPGEAPQDRRRAAISTWSAMVGAMMLARLVDDERLSDEILSATREGIRSGPQSLESGA